MRSLRVALALLLACAASLAAAQPFPSRSIRLIVDTSPGGLTDLLARLTAEALTVRLGQSVVVENKPGASGNVAADLVIRSPADGYTLLIAAAGNLAVKPFLERSVPFDPMVDIVPVINVADAAHILVVPGSMEAKDLAQFIAYAKANPGKVYYGSAGIGSPPHLSLELFSRLAGVKLTHVPYKGIGAALPDMLAGPRAGDVDQLWLSAALSENGPAPATRRGREGAARWLARRADFGAGGAARLGDERMVRGVRSEGHAARRQPLPESAPAIGHRRSQGPPAPPRPRHGARRRLTRSRPPSGCAPTIAFGARSSAMPESSWSRPMKTSTLKTRFLSHGTLGSKDLETRAASTKSSSASKSCARAMSRS
jgi:hypothetical protein